MRDDVKLFVIQALRPPIWGESVHDLSDRLRKAADLIESLAAELEQVKRERDAAVEDVAKLKRCEHCIGYEEFLKIDGRLNGRHDGYNVLFSAIDEMPEKPCYTCVNRDWDMPQCRECNSTNNFHWYVKEKT